MNISQDSLQKVSGKIERDYENLLSQIANNLLILLPSQFTEADILELEKILNELYGYSYARDWPLKLQEAILEALSRASELSYLIQNSDENIERKFFKTLKQLAPILYMISAHLGSNQDKNGNQ
jgi:hypothetical protein